MSFRKSAVLIVILVAAAVFLWRTSVDERDRRQRVEQRVRQQQSTEQPSESEPTWDLAELARRGLGQPLPDGYPFRRIEDGDYWFVGHRRADTGVEIPFAPGQLPRPPATREPTDTPLSNENPGFLGADACAECHAERHASFAQTSHYQSSRWLTPRNVAGRWTADANEMKTHDPQVSFTMIQRDGTLYQRVQFYDWQFEVPMQIALGSAKMGQSYLYFHGDQLYQENVTYLTAIDDWTNSPGYIDGDAAYARPIPARCMDCHVTYIDFLAEPNHYDPDSLITSISCERCHGPGQQHVQYHHAHPQTKQSKHIAVPSKLPRSQQLAVCGQCHSGTTPLTGKPFAFRPGDSLSEHYVAADASNTSQGVHTSNQLTRLAQSVCFQKSEMTCSSCHDPHVNQRGQMALFSERCLACHQPSQCGQHDVLGPSISQNCVDCHMPKQAAEKLGFANIEGSTFPPLRDHDVRIDQAATERYMQSHRPVPR